MNSPRKEEFLRINLVKKVKEAHALLRVVGFTDGEYQIAYAPSLNLSGYGATEQEAITMLIEVVLKDYLMSLLELPESQIMAELRQYGWKRRPFLAKQLLNTENYSPEKMIEDFNLPADTKFHEKFVTA